MNTQVNWKKIRGEFQRLADVEKLKTEVSRIGTEIRKFDFHSVLSPAAATKVKTFEKRYTELMRTIHQAQRQMDREFNRILRQIKVHRSDVNKVVAQQKDKLEKASTVLKKRFTTKKTAGKKTATRKTKTSARKRRKA
jgi:hypothetical protein